MPSMWVRRRAASRRAGSRVRLAACVAKQFQLRMFLRRARSRDPWLSAALLMLLLPIGCGRVGIDYLSRAGDDRDVPERDGGSDAAEWDDEPDAGSAVEPGEDAGADGDAATDRDASDEPGADGGRALDAGTDAAGTDAAAPLDASRGDAGASDGSAARDGATSGDASADAGDAASPVAPAGPRIFVDNPADGTTLRDFPVRVLLDTRALVNQGLLAADCSNLRIFAGAGCSEARSLFVAEHSCNTTTTEVWVRIPQLDVGAREVLAVAFDSARGEAADGRRVFPFFDGFQGSSLDLTRWIPRGSGTVTLSGGVLQSQGIMLLQSLPAAVVAGQSLLVVRLAALGMYDTDLEIGAGAMSDTLPQTVWAPGRSWDGISFVSQEFATYGFDGPAGSGCDDVGGTSLPPSIGASWVDHPPTAASFLTAEFAYANRGASEATLRTSRGASLRYTAPAGCSLPPSLPVLITLDHLAEAGSPTQRIDYVFVRPTAAREPSSSVLSTSTAACGSAP